SPATTRAPGRQGADGAQRGWSRAQAVRLYIPIGHVESLPNPVQVGLALGCTRPAAGRRLSGGGNRKQKSPRNGCRGDQKDSGSHMREALLTSGGSIHPELSARALLAQVFACQLPS